nr:MBL fold metallo-hydrolase [Corynebacterium pacaense]
MTEESTTGTTEEDTPADPLRQARTANLSTAVSENFPATPTVVADPGFSGVDASRLFFDRSDTVVVAGPGVAEELRAASIAIASHSPVLHATPETEAAVKGEIARLEASHVLVVGEALGDVDSGEINVIRDPGTQEALAQLTARQFEVRTVDSASEVVRDIAAVDPEAQVLLVPSWTSVPEKSDSDKLPAFPAQSNRDAEMAPVVVAAPESGISAVATARAYGADVRYMTYPDPRLNLEQMKMVAGLADQPLVALGEQFGSAAELSAKIRRGETVTTELPGGGGLVFPGRRMVALYGHPSGPALGAMGEQPPAEAVARVRELSEQYQPFSDQPVIPAFEVIATVASEFPGDDGNYSNESAPGDLAPYIDAITDAGGYAVIDLQPGRGSFLEQAKIYADLLKRPNVGLALDPEWKIGEGELPMSRVGSADASEINEVADWLAALTRDNGLPQKALILHQFQAQMLVNREAINTDHIELAFVLHADGHGTPEDKFETWNMLRENLSRDYFMAWKNFHDEDFPMFTPEQTLSRVVPTPWFVSYQ